MMAAAHDETGTAGTAPASETRSEPQEGSIHGHPTTAHRQRLASHAHREGPRGDRGGRGLVRRRPAAGAVGGLTGLAAAPFPCAAARTAPRRTS